MTDTRCREARWVAANPALPTTTSGTTGNPKGVVYSHRALTLHSFGASLVLP